MTTNLIANSLLHILQYYTPDGNTRRFRLINKKMSDFTHDSVFYKIRDPSKFPLTAKRLIWTSLDSVECLKGFKCLEMLICSVDSLILKNSDKITQRLSCFKCLKRLVISGDCKLDLDCSKLPIKSLVVSNCKSLTISDNLEMLNARGIRYIKCHSNSRFPSHIKKFIADVDIAASELIGLKIEELDIRTLVGRDVRMHGDVPDVPLRVLRYSSSEELNLENLTDLTTVEARTSPPSGLPSSVKSYSGTLTDTVSELNNRVYARHEWLRIAGCTREFTCPVKMFLNTSLDSKLVIHPETLKHLNMESECGYVNFGLFINLESLSTTCDVIDDEIKPLKRLKRLAITSKTKLTGKYFDRLQLLYIADCDDITDDLVLRASHIKHLIIQRCRGLTNECLVANSLVNIFITDTPSINKCKKRSKLKNIHINGSGSKCPDLSWNSMQEGEGLWSVKLVRKSK